MDLALSAEQQQFAAALHEMLSAADVPAAARARAGGDRKPALEVWRCLAEAGVTGLMVAPEHGGLGADPADLVIACEEIGHHAVPGPVPESVAAVPALLGAVRLADDAMRGQWLRQLAGGELIATLAAPPWLPLAADTDLAGLVLAADAGSLRLGTAGPPSQSVAAARTLAEVTAGEVITGEAADGGPEVAGAVTRALDFGALACAAELAGAGRALLETTAQYARQRVQFGHPIGSFQAVKHQLADVAIALEFARPLLFGAAIALAGAADGGSPADAARDVSAAKVACTEAASLAARTALQVHGAIGYTAENDISLHLTRVQALSRAWGSQAEHRARVLAALAAGGE
jgi:alkylation response protein AidB-like acyl-CoA dehydrogenase